VRNLGEYGAFGNRSRVEKTASRPFVALLAISVDVSEIRTTGRTRRFPPATGGFGAYPNALTSL